MNKITTIHSRNKFIILFFMSSVILHLILTPIFSNYYDLPMVLFGFVYAIGLLFFHFKGSNPTVLRIFIVLGSNLYVFSINFVSPDHAHMLYLIFPIIVTSIYNVVSLTLGVTLLTIIEIGILSSLPTSTYMSATQQNMLPHSASILIVVIVLCILYILKMGNEWKTMYSENERLDTIISSKAGYLELFFKHANDGIAVFDLDHKILVVNPAFEKMYGWKQNECVGTSPRFYPKTQDAQANERTTRVLNGESLHGIRTKELRKDGTTFDAELTIAPIYDNRHELVAISFISRDITHKIQAEKLRLDGERLKGMGEIAASVAHEVRNPLTSITGFIQLMKSDPTNPYSSYTEIMSTELKRIDVIVSEFLVLSKPSLQMSHDFFIEDTIQSVIDMFQPETSASSIHIQFKNPQERSMVSGNEGRLKQVFINLVKNSCQALVQNGIISIETAYDNGQVTISLSDNGPGMTPETIKNVYEPFYTTKPDGTGLGMMISKKIVVDHYGTITVTSQKNIGTQTVITLPTRV